MGEFAYFIVLEGLARTDSVAVIPPAALGPLQLVQLVLGWLLSAPLELRPLQRAQLGRVGWETSYLIKFFAHWIDLTKTF